MLKDSESLLVSGPGPRTQHPPWSLLTLAKGLLALSLVAAAVYASVLLHQLDKEVGMLRADLEHLKTNHFIDELRTFEKVKPTIETPRYKQTILENSKKYRNRIFNLSQVKGTREKGGESQNLNFRGMLFEARTFFLLSSVCV